MRVLTPSTALHPPGAGARPFRCRHHHRPTTNAVNRNHKQNPNPIPLSTSTPFHSSPRLYNRPSLAYYTELASKLAEDGKFAEFLMIYESVVASGVNASEFMLLVNSKRLGDGIAKAIGEGKVQSVVEVLLKGVSELGVEPMLLLDGTGFSSVRGECVRLFNCGELETLVSLMETLAGFRFPVKELVKPSDVIKLCVSQRSPNAAIRYARISPVPDFLTCSIILEFGKKRDLVSALAVFEASKQNSSSPNMHVYRTIIDVCGLCGDCFKSRAIYEELLSCNVIPNPYVFNSVMNVNAADLNYTLNIYKQMEKLGVTANITSHNIILKACGLAAKVSLALDIYREVEELEIKGVVKRDVFTYSTVIKVLADAKMWRQALEIKDDMISTGVTPDTVTWSSLIRSCAHAGLVEQAFKVFDEMLIAGCQPNAQCFNMLLHACTEARQYGRAFRLFQCWKETGFQPSMTHIDKSNLKDFVTLDEMNKTCCISTPSSQLTMKVPFTPRTSTYNILMKACGTDYYRAKALMDEMSSVGLSPDHISWSILIDIHGRSGNVKDAVQILRSMHKAGVQPDVITYTTAIKICVDHECPKLAFSLFAEMEKYQIKPNRVTYNTILRARTRYGSLQEVQQCLAIYQDMRKAGYKPNDYYLKQLIEEWCEGVIQNKDRKYDQAASRPTEFGHRNLLLERVAQHLEDTNDKSLSIDVRGLTKLEARIVILAVLRKIKEKYIAGHQVEDDILIILGANTETGGMEDTVMRLLQHDLGLEVMSVNLYPTNNVKGEEERLMHPNTTLGEVATTIGSSQAFGASARRPVNLRRLRVSWKSLHHWLRKRFDSSRQ